VDPDSSGVRGAGRGARAGREPRQTRGASRLAVVVTDDRGRPTGGSGLAAWLVAVAPKSARGEVAVALISDAQIRLLNRTYRRKNRVTDVLSFPSHSALRLPHLGDIAIATGVARRQAREAGHSYATELKVLALHGLLHLLGYDHHAAADDGRMARVEHALRKKGGLRAGLIERSGLGQ